MLERSQQERTKASSLGRGRADVVLFQQLGNERLRQILCLVDQVSFIYSTL